MKKLMLLSLGVIWFTTCTQAQEYKVKLANAKDRKVTFEINSADLKIEGTNGDELIIQGSSDAEPVPDRAKGLKAVYYDVVDNTGIGLAVTKDENGFKIEKAVRKSIKYTVRLPRKVAVKFQQTNWQGGSQISISNMDGDLEITSLNADVDLINVTGPVVANSTSGTIKVVYTNFNQEKPSSISNISGAVDIALPASAKSDLNMHSINGEIYTDFDLGKKPTKDGLTKAGFGNNIKAEINGGGVGINLNTISGNIYVRKQK